MMTLPELCEPVFLYVCRLIRASRKDGSFEVNRVRSEIKAILQDMRLTSSSDPRLSEQFRQVELPLLFFIDSTIAESRLPFAGEWNRQRLAFDRNELAGDEKFFELLDSALGDPSEQATERLHIFYTCIALGFKGWYAGQDAYMRRKLLEVSARIPCLIGMDPAARICPDAYEHLDTRDLVEPPGKTLLGIFIGLGGLAVFLFLLNVYLYRWASTDFSRVLSRIEKRTSYEE